MVYPALKIDLAFFSAIPMPLSITSRRGTPAHIGSQLNAGRAREAARLPQLIRGFHGVLEQIDQHLLKLTLLDHISSGTLPKFRCVRMPLRDNPSRNIFRALSTVCRRLTPLRVAWLPKLLCVRRMSTIWFAWPLTRSTVPSNCWFCCPGRRRKPPGTAAPVALAGHGGCSRPNRPVRLDSLRQGRESLQQAVFRQLFLQGSGADDDAVYGVADVVQDGVEDLQAPLCERLGQGFFGQHPVRHVTENDHPALRRAVRRNGSAADAEMHALRPGRIAYEYVHLIARLPLHGAHERQIVGGTGVALSL